MNQYIQIKNTVVLASKPPWLLTPPTRIATNPKGHEKKTAHEMAQAYHLKKHRKRW